MTPSSRFTAALVLLCGGFASAQTLEVVTLEPDPLVGRTTTVEVRISELGNFASPALRTFDLTLSFDPAVLTFTGAGFETQLGHATPAPTEALTGVIPATAQVFQVSLLPSADLIDLQPEEFTLLRASFNVVGEGTSDVMVNGILGDENGDPLPATGAVLVLSGTIAPGPVTDIPTLSSWGTLLMIGALTGVGILLLRRMM